MAVAPKKLTCWLIFRARDQSLRTVKSAPNLDWDEIAWKTVLTIPSPWGHLDPAEVHITLPETPPTEIVVTALERPA